MSVLKQLHTKINGKTTDVYPMTSTDAVLNPDGTTLKETLENLSSGGEDEETKKLLGEHDISSIGDGTITGAIVYLNELSADLSSIADTLDIINRTEV